MIFSFYLNKLTGEVFGAREKRKFDREVLSDKAMFQTLKAHKPVVFVKTDENGDYKGKAIEFRDTTLEILKKLSEEGYGLNENFKPNLDLARQFKVCLHCLKKINYENSYSQINLDELRDYYELKRLEFRYYNISQCKSCKKTTRTTHYITSFHSLTQLSNLKEVIVDEKIKTDARDNIAKKEKVSEIIVGKTYDISVVEGIDNIENHEAIKTLLKYKDFKSIEYIKFKRVNNYFTSKEFEKKYKVKALIY